MARARAAGVTDVRGARPWSRAAGSGSSRSAPATPGRCTPALGIHPQALPGSTRPTTTGTSPTSSRLLARGGAVAVGECGLDGPSAGAGAPLDRQRAVLRGHLAIARRLGLPVLLHSLRAHDAMREELERDGVPSGGVLHSFSGSAEQVPPFAALGLHFSFAGPVTYEAARKPSAAARAVPPDRLLVETDAPDQTPHPHRGRGTSPPTCRSSSRRWPARSDPRPPSSTRSRPGTPGASFGSPRPDP